MDEKQKAWLRKVAGERGFVGVSTVNGRTCAGTICTYVGNNFFLHVLAHDMAFDAYSLGTLNSYLTVCEGIGRGGKEFHFLWGPSAWKDRLGAKQRALDNIVVYRSWLDILLCPRTVIACLFEAYWRRFKLGLIAAADPAKPFGWIVRPCLEQWYRLKRLGHRLHARAAQRRQP